MVLNGLGFNEWRLCIFSSFFGNLSTEQLLRPEITPEHLNDDVLLRTLHRIYKYGSTDLQIYSRIAIQVLMKVRFGSQPLHVDSTSFSGFEKYGGRKRMRRGSIPSAPCRWISPVKLFELSISAIKAF